MFEKLVIPDSEFTDKFLLFLEVELFLLIGQIFSLDEIGKLLLSVFNVFESNIIAFLITLILLYVNISFVVNFMPDKKRGN